MFGNYYKLITLFIVVLAFLSCKKKEKSTSTPEPPAIELISVTPSTVKEFKDSVLVKIKYKDRNGDLGDPSPDEHSLSIKDSRLANADTYHVKPLAPVSDKDIPIEGELTIKLNSLFLIGTGTSENATLVIKIKDRQGQWSNEITAPAITITK
jgi:hypothetical protein